MDGRRLVSGFLVFLVFFTAALIYFQFFAFYHRQRDIGSIPVGGGAAPVTGYDGIDATSSPLKLRGCFRIDPSALAGLHPLPADDATPLMAPFWFRCFDARKLTQDLASGAARAYKLDQDAPASFALMLAVYPDGRGYLWRQLARGYSE